MIIRKLLVVSVILTLIAGQPHAAGANPVGDFFKKVGRSISHIRKDPTPSPRPRKSSKNSNAAGEKTVDGSATSVLETERPVPTPTPVPLDIRPAALAPKTDGPRDVPYAVAVPDKPGFVTSPYAPNQGLVDVRNFPSSTEVLDPFTGKIFLTP